MTAYGVDKPYIAAEEIGVFSAHIINVVLFLAVKLPPIYENSLHTLLNFFERADISFSRFVGFGMVSHSRKVAIGTIDTPSLPS